jgi:hypothetical protein
MESLMSWDRPQFWANKDSWSLVSWEFLDLIAVIDLLLIFVLLADQINPVPEDH